MVGKCTAEDSHIKPHSRSGSARRITACVSNRDIWRQRGRFTHIRSARILHEDSKNAIFREPTFPQIFLSNLCVEFGNSNTGHPEVESYLFGG